MPVDEGVDVAQDRAALLAGRNQRVRLRRDLGLGLGAGHEAAAAEDEADRAHPGEVDRRRSAVVAGLLEQRAAVLRRDPARGEDAAVIGVGVDVRDVVLVPLDRHARIGDRLDGDRPVRAGPERLGLEVLQEVGVG